MSETKLEVKTVGEILAKLAKIPAAPDCPDLQSKLQNFTKN